MAFDPTIKRNEGRSIPVKERNGSFSIVELEFTEEEARKESSRCLQCKNPNCIKGCPLHLPIKEFIHEINESNYKKARELIDEISPFTSLCAKVCDHAKQCEGSCIRNFKGESVRIGKLHSFILSKTKVDNKFPPLLDKKVAVIGAGPSGLTVAYELRKQGIDVTIYEKENKLGGIPNIQIPSFRLDENSISNCEEILKNNVKIHYNSQTNYLDLINEYDAVFLGIGTQQCKGMGIPNENLENVILSDKLLKDIKNDDFNKYKNYKNIFVIGGGNVAIDCVRSLTRINNNVTLVYRRSINEAPARKDEIKEAEQEGVKFMFLTNPVSFIGENKLSKIELIKMELGEKDESGRCSFNEIKDSNFILDTDLVVLAISSTGDSNSIKNLTNNRNLLVVNENYQTSNPKVFAAGDIVSGPKTVVEALSEAKKAAYEIINYLNKKAI